MISMSVSPRANAASISGSATSNHASSATRRVLWSLIQTTTGPDLDRAWRREILVLGEGHSFSEQSRIPDRGVGRILHSTVGDVLSFMSRANAPVRAAIARQPKTASGDVEHRMVTLPCRVFQRSGDIARFEQWIVAEDFFTAGARGKQAEHVGDPDSEAAKTGPPTTLGRIDSNSAQFAHRLCLCAAFLPARCDFAAR
jgi:hypothetical protein